MIRAPFPCCNGLARFVVALACIVLLFAVADAVRRGSVAGALVCGTLATVCAWSALKGGGL